MTNEFAIKVLKAKLECFKNETSGINHDCNMRLCDGCSLNYEQGNMGEQKEALKTAIKVLEQTSWIPVSERLPKEYEFVNCTCHSLIDDREDWVIETVYIPQPSDSPYSDWGNIPMLNSGDCKVVAWMHRDIPEPYKAESEDEE